VSLSDEARRNRAYWNRKSDEYQERHAEFIGRPEPRWGVWQIPESELSVLGDVAGRDVLELGCGAAQWSILLARQGARVVGLDNSERQLEHARQNMAKAGLDFPLVHASAEHVPLPDGGFDVVFCDHGAVAFVDPYKTVPEAARLLRPGGLLVAQCGGRGNIARFHAAAREVGAAEPYADHLVGWTGPWNFAGAEETAERLERAGFADVDTWLEPYPVTPDDPPAFVRAVCLRPHLERLPAELHDRFVEAVCSVSGSELDYVRLNIDARKPS